MKEKIAASACLCGLDCRYDGKKLQPIFDFASEEVFAICPEIMGGLYTPRTPCEIVGGDGNDVLDNKARVKNSKGEDVTENFVKGAYRALEVMQKNNVLTAYLKSRSPSCGLGEIYDGTFSNTKIKGDGVTVALLKRNEIKVIKID